MGEGNNWCSPYKGWQKAYDNSPLEIVKNQGYGYKKHLILGKSTFQTKRHLLSLSSVWISESKFCLVIVVRSLYIIFVGGEAALWTEQADSTSIDSRLWPRSAAMAERLWTEPSFKWYHAEQRMLRHRERLVEQGINADSLEPEWCLQNQGSCYA